MMRRRWMAGLALACNLATADAATLTGQVSQVADGDTLTLRARSRPVKVRLVNIDAPESDQAWGFQSKRSLESLVRLETVRVRTRGRDKYQRVLGEVIRVRDGLDVNLEQVRKGMAWAYTRGTAKGRFEAEEQTARENRVGLWQDSAPVRPGNWRRRQHADGSATGSPEDAAPPPEGKAQRSAAWEWASPQFIESHTFFIQAASRESAAGLTKSQPPGAIP